jgi:predicted transcriptional regulator
MATSRESEITADIVADLKETSERRRILSHLQKGEAMRITKIAKDLRIAAGNVHHHTEMLQTQELIKKWTGTPKRSYAQITDKGKRALVALRQKGAGD